MASHLRRRKRKPLAVAAMGLGILVGLALLSTMRPGQVADPNPAVEPARKHRVQRDLQVVRPPAEAPTADGVHAEPERRHLALAPVDTGVRDAASLIATVVVDVVDPEGRPADRGAQVVPVSCPGFGRTAQQGEFTAEPGSCTLRAMRRDGALFARSHDQTVTMTRGEPAYMQLELNRQRTGGIGVRFQPQADGMRVLQVMPNTPAWDAGLEPGDSIVGVDGQAIEGMDSDAFVAAMTGPEGSEVDFTVAFSTDTGTSQESLRVTRQFLDG